MTMTREENARELEAGARLVSVDNPSIGGVMMAAAAMLREGRFIAELDDLRAHERALEKRTADLLAILADALAGLEPFSSYATAAIETRADQPNDLIWMVFKDGGVLRYADLRRAIAICIRLRAALGEQT